MEHLILDLLILSPTTGYKLQQFIRNNLSLICSSSAGSVYTALKKLQSNGHISFEEALYGKRRRKIFSITKSGQEVFADWISQPI